MEDLRLFVQADVNHNGRLDYNELYSYFLKRGREAEASVWFEKYDRDMKAYITIEDIEAVNAVSRDSEYGARIEAKRSTALALFGATAKCRCEAHLHHASKMPYTFNTVTGEFLRFGEAVGETRTLVRENRLFLCEKTGTLKFDGESIGMIAPRLLLTRFSMDPERGEVFIDGINHGELSDLFFTDRLVLGPSRLCYDIAVVYSAEMQHLFINGHAMGPIDDLYQARNITLNSDTGDVMYDQIKVGYIAAGATNLNEDKIPEVKIGDKSGKLSEHIKQGTVVMLQPGFVGRDFNFRMEMHSSLVRVNGELLGTLSDLVTKGVVTFTADRRIMYQNAQVGVVDDQMPSGPYEYDAATGTFLADGQQIGLLDDLVETGQFSIVGLNAGRPKMFFDEANKKIRLDAFPVGTLDSLLKEKKITIGEATGELFVKDVAVARLPKHYKRFNLKCTEDGALDRSNEFADLRTLYEACPKEERNFQNHVFITPDTHVFFDGIQMGHLDDLLERGEVSAKTDLGGDGLYFGDHCMAELPSGLISAETAPLVNRSPYAFFRLYKFARQSHISPMESAVYEHGVRQGRLAHFIKNGRLHYDSADGLFRLDQEPVAAYCGANSTDVRLDPLSERQVVVDREAYEFMEAERRGHVYLLNSPFVYGCRGDKDRVYREGVYHDSLTSLVNQGRVTVEEGDLKIDQDYLLTLPAGVERQLDCHGTVLKSLPDRETVNTVFQDQNRSIVGLTKTRGFVKICSHSENLFVDDEQVDSVENLLAARQLTVTEDGFFYKGKLIRGISGVSAAEVDAANSSKDRFMELYSRFEQHKPDLNRLDGEPDELPFVLQEETGGAQQHAAIPQPVKAPLAAQVDLITCRSGVFYRGDERLGTLDDLIAQGRVTVRPRSRTLLVDGQYACSLPGDYLQYGVDCDEVKFGLRSCSTRAIEERMACEESLLDPIYIEGESVKRGDQILCSVDDALRGKRLRVDASKSAISFDNEYIGRWPSTVSVAEASAGDSDRFVRAYRAGQTEHLGNFLAYDSERHTVTYPKEGRGALPLADQMKRGRVFANAQHNTVLMEGHYLCPLFGYFKQFPEAKVDRRTGQISYEAEADLHRMIQRASASENAPHHGDAFVVNVPDRRLYNCATGTGVSVTEAVANRQLVANDQCLLFEGARIANLPDSPAEEGFAVDSRDGRLRVEDEDRLTRFLAREQADWRSLRLAGSASCGEVLWDGRAERFSVDGAQVRESLDELCAQKRLWYDFERENLLLDGRFVGPCARADVDVDKCGFVTRLDARSTALGDEQCTAETLLLHRSNLMRLARERRLQMDNELGVIVLDENRVGVSEPPAELDATMVSSGGVTQGSVVDWFDRGAIMFEYEHMRAAKAFRETKVFLTKKSIYSDEDLKVVWDENKASQELLEGVEVQMGRTASSQLVMTKAIENVKQIFVEGKQEREMAKELKLYLDDQFGRIWQVIVSRSRIGCQIGHYENMFVNFVYRGLTFIAYRTPDFS